MMFMKTGARGFKGVVIDWLAWGRRSKTNKALFVVSLSLAAFVTGAFAWAAIQPYPGDFARYFAYYWVWGLCGVALLLDLDGTLAETDSLHLPTWVDVLQPYGMEVDEGFYKESISGRSNSKILEDLLPDLSAEEGQKLADAKEASFRERAGELEPLPGLLDFMQEGKSRGLSLALVTN